MKIIANIFRVFVGLLFIFSGFIKSNDPTGFSYKLDEYFSVFAEDLRAQQDSVEYVVTAKDQELRFKEVLSPYRPSVQLVASPTQWKGVSTDSDLVDSIYLGTALLSINNREVLSETLNPGDTGSILLEAKVSALINGEVVAQEEFDYSSWLSNDRIATVDYSSKLKEDSFLVSWFQKMRSYVLPLSIFICVLEILLGIALLLGWAPKLTVWSLLIMIILFTFLTYYSATYDKVTDCGCFGDAIKLTPWQSFYKDLILLVSSLIILMGLRHIKSIFNTPFTVKVLTVFTLLSIGFAMYCWYYLPVMNFLKFKKGNDIEFLATVPEGAPTDEYAFTFIYEKDGKQERFSEAEMAEKNPKANGYKFVDRIDTLIKKGYEPEIHDFAIMDETRNNDYIDDFFADKNAKLFIVIKEVETARPKAIKQLAKYLKPWKKKGHSVYILTASNVESVEAFRHEYQLTEPFYYGDKTNLKSIIRSNPGLLLFKGNVVEGTWPSTRLPSIETLLQMADD